MREGWADDQDVIVFERGAVDPHRDIPAERRMPHIPGERLHFVTGDRAKLGQRLGILPVVIDQPDRRVTPAALVRGDADQPVQRACRPAGGACQAPPSP